MGIMKFQSKNIVYNILIINILFNIFGCSGQTTSQNFKKRSKIKLEKLYDVKLDNELFFTWNGSEMLCWDKVKNKVKRFDLKKKCFYQEYETEIKNHMEYSEMLNIGFDSLLSYSLSDNYNVVLINYHGKILNKFNLSPNKSINISLCEKKRHPSCHLYGTNGNTRYNDYFYYAAYNIGENKISGKLFSGGKLNIKTGRFEYFTEFPAIYNSYNWGAIYYYFPYITTNDHGQLIISYPACHDLYIYNLKNGKNEIVNGGSSLFSTIKPFSNKKELVLELKAEYTKYFDLNYAYGIISYDKKRKMYYRETLFPEENYGKSSKNIRKKSIIVLDNKFNFLGEELLPDDKNYYHLLATDYGIVISYYDFENMNFGFTLFNLKIL